MSKDIALIIMAVFGSVVSIITAKFPAIRDQYEKLTPTRKGLVQVGIMFFAACALLGLSCAQIIDKVSCDGPGVILALQGFLYALAGNVGTFITYSKPSEKERLDALYSPPEIT